MSKKFARTSLIPYNVRSILQSCILCFTTHTCVCGSSRCIYCDIMMKPLRNQYVIQRYFNTICIGTERYFSRIPTKDAPARYTWPYSCLSNSFCFEINKKIQRNKLSSENDSRKIEHNILFSNENIHRTKF